MPIRSRRPIAVVAIAAIAAVFICIAPQGAEAQSAADKGKKKTDNCLVTLDGDHLDTVQSLADGDRLWLTTVDHQHRLAAHHAGQADILRGCRT